MTPQEFLDQVNKNSDKDYGILPPGISNADALDILIKHFLGDDWYATGSIHNDQVNTEAVYEILKKFPNGIQEKQRRKQRIKNRFHNIFK